MEGNQNCRAYYHGSLSTSVLEERPSKLTKQQRYIKTASIGKGQLYKWRLEVVSFVLINPRYFVESESLDKTILLMISTTVLAFA